MTLHLFDYDYQYRGDSMKVLTVKLIDRAGQEPDQFLPLTAACERLNDLLGFGVDHWRQWLSEGKDARTTGFWYEPVDAELDS